MNAYENKNKSLSLIMFRSSHIFVFWFFGILVTLVFFFPFFFPSSPSCLANVSKDYTIFLYFRNFVAKSDQKPKTKNGMNETEVTQKESRSVCNLVVILHGEIFEFSYRSFFPSTPYLFSRIYAENCGVQTIRMH